MADMVGYLLSSDTVIAKITIVALLLCRVLGLALPTLGAIQL